MKIDRLVCMFTIKIFPIVYNCVTSRRFSNSRFLFQFEWAWQNPSLSRRLKSLPAKTKSEKAYDYHVRLMYSMLTLTPWCLLPLTVQWLKQDYFRNHPTDNFPPTHMPICYGPVKSKSKKSKPRSAKTGHSESDVEVETLHVGKSCDVCSKVFQVNNFTV